MPGSVLGTGYTAMNKRKSLSSWNLQSRTRKRINMYTNKYIICWVAGYSEKVTLEQRFECNKGVSP